MFENNSAENDRADDHGDRGSLGSAYVSTTNSMYCIVSILVYVILAVLYYSA